MSAEARLDFQALGMDVNVVRLFRRQGAGDHGSRAECGPSGFASPGDWVTQTLQKVAENPGQMTGRERCTSNGGRLRACRVATVDPSRGRGGERIRAQVCAMKQTDGIYIQ